MREKRRGEKKGHYCPHGIFTCYRLIYCSVRISGPFRISRGLPYQASPWRNKGRSEV